MSFFQINSTELHNQSEQLLGLNQRLRQEKETLMSNETNLKSMWEGEANESFHQAFMRDAGQMDVFIELIDNYSKVMEAIASRYDSAEARNLEMANARTY